MGRHRVIRWRVRGAWALLLGTATAVVVSWAIAILPIEDWLQVSKPLPRNGGFYVITPPGADGKGWAAAVHGTTSPLSKSVTASAWVLTKYDAKRACGDVEYYWPGANATSSVAPEADLEAIMERGTIEAIPRIRGESMVSHRTGWPFQMLEFRASGTGAGGPFVTATPTPVISGGWALPTEWSPSGKAVLPLTPRWPAVVWNVVFWGCFWLALLSLPRLARAIEWRIKRLCPRCGYSLRGTPEPGCPECGWGRAAA